MDICSIRSILAITILILSQQIQRLLRLNVILWEMKLYMVILLTIQLQLLTDFQRTSNTALTRRQLPIRIGEKKFLILLTATAD